MNLQKAEEIVKSQIKQYNLDYSFKFDKAKKRLGRCSYKKNLITLSKFFVELNSEERVLKTITHEIAHALTRSGHDKKWKQKVIDLGGIPSTCYSLKDTNLIEGKYIYTCHNCKKEYSYHRKLKRLYSCGICSGKKFNFDYVLTLKLEHLEEDFNF